MEGRRLVDRWEDDSKMFLELRIKDNALPTLYGGIVGDLLGVPVEFKQRGTFHIQGVEGYGTYNQPPGTWSDDTSLTLCLMENTVEEGTLEDLMNKFVAYRDTGYLTPYGTMFDIGRTTVESIDRFKNGAPPSRCGGASLYDNGNGAIMRLAPLVFSHCDENSFLTRVERIKQYTELTHAHPRAIVGSIIYMELLFWMYNNDTLKRALEKVNNLFHERFPSNHEYLTEFEHYKRIFQEDFFHLPEADIRSDGYVVHTLEAAIWCLGTTSTFKEAVLKAVNLGEDTDTVASITGSLGGMFYKMEGIPTEWLEAIAQKEQIDQHIKAFYKYWANTYIIKEHGSL